MGSTMRAALSLCRNQGAKEVIVAVPVAGYQVIQIFKQLADEIIVLESPSNFYAVAQVYENWYDVSDDEVLDIMRRGK